MSPAGLKQNTPDPGKTAQLATGAAQVEAFLGDFAPNDPELIAVVRAWDKAAAGSWYTHPLFRCLAVSY